MSSKDVLQSHYMAYLKAYHRSTSCQEGQDQIYFVTGEGRRAAEIAPAMEKMRLKACLGLELYS